MVCMPCQVTGGGIYTIWQDDEAQSVHLKSPFSGYFMYRFDAENGCWMSEKESHNILELLLRELIVVCNGLPSWNV
jgi:frataxin-like iron-binding protein CyaY